MALPINDNNKSNNINLLKLLLNENTSLLNAFNINDLIGQHSKIHIYNKPISLDLFYYLKKETGQNFLNYQPNKYYRNLYSTVKFSSRVDNNIKCAFIEDNSA